MRNYLTGGRENNGGHFSPFKTGINNFESESEIYSWLDIFLRDDVHIVGLGLDYNEIDLWWLLSYKARLKQKNSLKIGETHYHHFHVKPLDKKEKAKHQILKSSEVNVHTKHIDGNYHSAYEEFINKEI